MTKINYNRLKIIEQTPYLITDDVLLSDFKWLIEQTKKAQDLQEKNEHLERLMEQSYVDWLINDSINMQNKLIEAGKINIKLREGLEFYANEENYDPPYLYTMENNVPVHDESKVDLDFGKLARKVLEDLYDK